MTNDPLSNQVNHDEVHDLLTNANNSDQPKVEKKFDLKADDHAQLKSALGNAKVDDTEASTPAVDKPADTPIAQPFTPQTENLNDFLAWTFKSSSIPDVTVSDFEKGLFFKALLNDTEFCLDIEFELIEKLVVSVRGLTAYEQKIIAAALKVDADKGEIDGPHGFASFMQQYCLAYQVITFNSKPFGGIEVTKLPQLTFAEHVNLLREFMRKQLDSMPSFKLMTLIKALIIFEIKQKLLHDGLVNRNFWKPQGIV